MKLYHATLDKRKDRIYQQGLRCDLALGAKKVVWLHKPSRTSWAYLHTVMRHGGDVRDVVILEVEVPRKWLRRSGVKGLWYSVCDIPPERIRFATNFRLDSVSPLLESA